jgi:hypothetical protein
VAYGGLLKCLEVFMLFEVDLVWFSRFSGLWWTLDMFVVLGQIRCARSLARSQAEQAKLPWEFKAAPCDGTVPGRWNRMKSDDPCLIIMSQITHFRMKSITDCSRTYYSVLERMPHQSQLNRSKELDTFGRQLQVRCFPLLLALRPSVRSWNDRIQEGSHAWLGRQMGNLGLQSACIDGVWTRSKVKHLLSFVSCTATPCVASLQTRFCLKVWIPALQLDLAGLLRLWDNSNTWRHIATHMT